VLVAIPPGLWLGTGGRPGVKSAIDPAPGAPVAGEAAAIQPAAPVLTGRTPGGASDGRRLDQPDLS
jgi:hypothetical protein